MWQVLYYILENDTSVKHPDLLEINAGVGNGRENTHAGIS